MALSENGKSLLLAFIIVCLLVLVISVGAYGSKSRTSTENDLKSLDDNISATKSQSNSLMQNKTQIETQITQLQSQLETEKATLARNQTLLKNLTDSSTAEKSTLQKQFETEDAKTKTELTNFSTIQTDYNEKTAKMNADIATLQTSVNDSSANIASLNGQITGLISKLNECNSNLSMLNKTLQALISVKKTTLAKLQKCMYLAENRSCQLNYPNNFFKTRDGKGVICPDGYSLMDYGSREICTLPFNETTPQEKRIDARGSFIPCYGVWPNDAWDYPSGTDTNITTSGKFIWAPQGFVTDPMPANLVCNQNL